MDFNLTEGRIAKTETQVELKDTAFSFGSGSLKVLATPRMIGLMENAALKAVDGELPEGYGTVGIHLDVKHLSASPVGMKVTAQAELIEIQGKKLSFKVTAWDEREKIGEGTHTRYIVHANSFIEKTSEKINP